VSYAADLSTWQPEKLREEDHKFEANLGYIGRLYLKTKAKTKTQ
jgi:hypothetical protein